MRKRPAPRHSERRPRPRGEPRPSAKESGGRGLGRALAAGVLRFGSLTILALAALACNGDDGPTATERAATPTPSPGEITSFTPRLTPAPAAKGWRTLAPMPTPRSEVTVAAVAGKIYVIGGFEGDGSPSDAVEVYDPVTDTWSEIAQLPEPRHHAAATAVADRFLYVFGGFGAGFDDARATVYRYDPDAQTSEERAPMPTARGGHAVTPAACPGLTGACLYAIGGSDNARQNVPEVEAYDDVTNSWTAAAPMITPRDHLAAHNAAANGKLYAIGGRVNVDFGQNLDANEEYDPETDAWTARAPLPTARSGIAAALLNGRIYVFGGEGSQGTFGENEAYDPQTNTWETLEPMPTARHGLGAAVVGDTIYVIGGGETPGLSVSAANEAFKP